jgi:glycosyltransferase involved in cell wall biosynthesis
MLSIGIISSYPPPPIGIATYTRKLCESLAEEGVNVIVFSNTAHLENSKIKVVKAWNQGIFYPFRLFKKLSLVKPDVIHIQHEYWLYGRGIFSVSFLLLLLLLKALMRPIVITAHCVIPRGKLTRTFFEKHRLGRRMSLAKKLYFIFYNAMMNLLASKIIVHSAVAKGILVDDYSFEPRKLKVIPHGADPINQHKEDPLNRERAYKLLVFGEIRRGKGIEYAMRAVQRLITNNISCELIIAGMYDTNISPESVGYLEELEELIIDLKLGGYVKFKLNVPEGDVGKLFTEADIAIFPYVEDEIIAASGPLLTAMSFGKPIVATNLRRFVGYLVNGENSLIVKPENPYELADAIISISHNDKLRVKISESALKYAREISWRNIAKHTLSVYEELVKNEFRCLKIGRPRNSVY